MKSLTSKQQNLYQNAQICYICIKNEDKRAQYKKYCKVSDQLHNTGEYRGAVHSICNLRHSAPKEISVYFHNGSNYDYHFMIKDLAEAFEK